MLDLKFVLENLDRVRAGVAAKNVRVDLAPIAPLAEKRKVATSEGDKLRADRNAISEEVGKRKKAREDAADLMAQSTALGEKIAALEKEVAAAEERIREILLYVPNLADPDVPVAADESGNRIVATWGEKPKIEKPRAHWEIAEILRLLDLERGAKVSGADFPLYIGLGARLERALLQFMLDLQTREHGYTEVYPPFVANRAAMVGSGQLPKFADQMYKIEGDDLFLIPTAEIPLTNMHAGEILPAAELPKRYTAFTACWRREAGAAGRETRGITRVHQFNKVELMTYSAPEDSPKELEKIRHDAEEVLRRLALHYQVKLLCTGDLGFSSAKTYDLEVWAPGAGKYLEVSSCSNFRDYQARRANLRVKGADKKVRFVHTLNGSGVATPRLLIALLEQNQRPDGSVGIPEALRPYLDGRAEIRA
ncbi:MAG: serine--tRNA ligase [Planctomycetales bacterium]|nr:serine--tRNA ligase [Planctomycetales bacterium]